MSEKTLFSYSALFDTPDQIMLAAKAVQNAGYKKYDVNTPYPVHGMDGAMQLKPSKLGYVALFFGMSGLLSAIMLTVYTNLIDYPLVIGGKPFYAFPGYVPVYFELTVLLASVLTVATMLFIFFKLPNNKHPLHDSDYMRSVSSDKYGLYIEADDPIFDEGETRTFLEGLEGANVTAIYLDEDELQHENKIFEPKFISLLVLLVLISSGSTYFMLNKLLFMQPFNWMMEQGKVIPQEKSELFADGFGMRPPVQGTVARGTLPYAFAAQPEKAAEFNINPLFTKAENLALGKTKLDIYWSPCHGYHGEGDSRLRGQFPHPTTLQSEKVRNWTDGRIFHVITEGQNVMPSYSSQLSRQEKWAVILYVRALQRSLNAKETDVK